MQRNVRALLPEHSAGHPFHAEVLRLRIKDKHAKHLLAQSREANQVWNYSQNLALQVLARENRFMSGYDMAAYTKGAL